jgi:3-oxosteroid 1-dehydrogenase
VSEPFGLICVGGGLGGLAAAVRAAHAGVSVLVLEKTQFMGGVAAYSGGATWIPGNHLAAEAGLEDTREAAEAYFGWVGGKDLPFDEELRKTFFDRGPEAIEFYTKAAGVAFELLTLGEQYYPQVEGSTTGIRHIEATVNGIDLGDWADRLRPSGYHDARYSINDHFAGMRAGVSAAEHVGEVALAEREDNDFLGRGRGLAGAFLKAALDLGVRMETNSPVSSLVFDGDRVVGVRVTLADGRVQEHRADHGVLIATGSYGSAPWAAEMEGLPELFEQAPPILDGDGLRLAEQAGAAIVRAGYPFCTIGFESPTVLHPGTDVPMHVPVLEALPKPHIIVVNQDAQRFGDESFYGVFANAISLYDGNAKRFANWPPYAIMDDRFRSNGYEFGRLSGWAEADPVSADTLEELAEKLGLDPAALRASVDRYNASVEAGVDADFGRGSLAVAEYSGDPGYPNPNLGTIEVGPFWGKRLHVLTAGISTHGMSIDSSARVLTRDRRAVEGLYATGNAVAHAELPFGYENGFANGRNITYAFVAASHVVAVSRSAD